MNNEAPEDSYTHISYLQKYGLTREPFSVDSTSNQDDFFLLDSERAQRLNMLYHMCQNSELLLVVSGEKGSGKTSLLNKFMDMRTDNWRQCIINATATTNPDQLLIEIAEGFGLPQDTVNFGSGLEMLQKRLTEMKRSELMPILIIDDAHELPTASLTILLKLSELSEADERLLRIVLFGEPAINDMFNAPELKEVKHRITHTLTMPQLSEKQSIEYIQYRLSVAGLQNDNPFSNAQMKRIYRQANGIPGLINQFAQELLLTSFANSNPSKPTSLPLQLRSGLSILLILGIAATVTWFLSRDVIDSLGESQQKDSAKLEIRDLPLLPPSTKLPDKQQPNSNHPASTNFDAFTGSVSPKLSSIDNTTEIVSGTKPPSTIPTENVPNDNIAILITPAATESPSAPISITTTNQLNTENLKTNKITSVTSIPATVEAKVNIIKPASVVAKADVGTEKSIAVIKPTLTSKATTKPDVLPLVKADWLSRQNPQHFTLQLMGSRKRDSLTLVQRAHKISTQSGIVRTQLKGSDWYILVHKSFATKQQAREGIQKLKKTLQLTQPWPRRIKELQALN